MTNNKWLFQLICAVLIIIVFAYYAQATDYEALGRNAESEGKLRTAITHYVNALQSVSEGNSKDVQLREKIIKLSQKLTPPPELSEEAERHIARGRRAFKTANNKEGFIRAADEFKKALQIAPWFADVYFNLGVVLDKAGKYNDAIRNLRLYLAAVPSDKDAKSLIYEIEYQKEEASRQRLKAKEEEKNNQLASLSGNWNVKFWDEYGKRPTIYGEWRTDHYVNQKARILIQGNKMKITLLQDFSETDIFKGIISNNTISGKVYPKIDSFPEGLCPPKGTTYDFEGQIWYNEQIIMLVTPNNHVYGGQLGCRYYQNKYYRWNLLLEK